MKKSIVKCLDCVCKSSAFRELTNEELIRINKNRVEVNFKKGETIVKQGSIAASIVFIKKGIVMIQRDYSGKELVLSLEKKGRLLGLHSLFNKNTYSYSIIACEDVKACVIEAEVLNEFMNSNAKFAAALLKTLKDDTLFLYDRMACLVMKQMNGRFADLLLCLSLRIYRRKNFKIPLNRKDLALITNMSQESLSRVIKDFVTEGIIDFDGNEITIHDFDKIKHLSLVG